MSRYILEDTPPLSILELGGGVTPSPLPTHLPTPLVLTIDIEPTTNAIDDCPATRANEDDKSGIGGAIGVTVIG